jgi:hypothetical protein
VRININVPEEWLPFIQKLADKRGVSLSKLFSEAAISQLPASERKKLPPARKPGRPKKES